MFKSLNGGFRPLDGASSLIPTIGLAGEVRILFIFWNSPKKVDINAERLFCLQIA